MSVTIKKKKCRNIAEQVAWNDYRITKLVGEGIEECVHKLGKEAVSGQPYHFPYHFTAEVVGSKLKVKLWTITLDNEKTLVQYEQEVQLPTGPVGSVAWGAITGTINDQTDLMNLINGKSTVSVSATGTATDEISYITIDGVEKKIAGGGGGGDVSKAYVDAQDALLQQAINNESAARSGADTTLQQAINEKASFAELNQEASDRATADAGLNELIGENAAAIEDLTDTKQDKLPTTVNDKYLHTNAATGSLEWSDVAGGGGGFEWITSDMSTPLTADQLALIASKKPNVGLKYVMSGMEFAFTFQTEQSGEYTFTGYTDIQQNSATLYGVKVNMTSGAITSLYTGFNLVNATPSGEPTADLNKIQIGSVVYNVLSKCTLQTTAPSAAITDGGIHIVILSAEPTTKYDGYIYMINE